MAANTDAAAGEPSCSLASRTARHRAISSVPVSRGSDRPSASPSRPASNAAIALNPMASGLSASLASPAAASRSMACASAPRPSATMVSRRGAPRRRPGKRRRHRRGVDFALQLPQQARSRQGRKIDSDGSCWSRRRKPPHPAARPPGQGRPARRRAGSRSGTTRRRMLSDNGSTAIPCHVGSRTNSLVRRATGTPCPGWRSVPTSTIPPVSGSDDADHRARRRPWQNRGGGRPARARSASTALARRRRLSSSRSGCAPAANSVPGGR